MPSDGFETALLAPEAPVPASIKGRPERRFAVYRNNVVVGLVRAMESNFPAVRRLLGEAYFAGLAREYVMAHPPQNPLMFVYGATFPAYLLQQPDLEPYPYLADVARLESLMRESHHAADAEPLPANALANLAPEQLEMARFVPHPATRFLCSDFAAGNITSANRDGHSIKVDVAKPETVFVTRQQFSVSLTSFAPSTGAFLIALHSGEQLGNAADAAFANNPGFDLGGTLGAALAHGLFTALKLESDS